MPNWKKLIVSGSDASLNTLNVNTALTASGLSYPSADGTANQVISTDGNGVLSFTDASAASPDITGSSLVTASISSNILSFTKGDTTSFNITLPQGGGSTNLSATAHLTQSVASQTWSFAHNLDDRIPVLTVFDSNHDVIIPERIEMVDEDNMSIYFSSARTGFASAVVLGVTSSFASTATNAYTASYVDFDNIDNKPTLISGSAQIASDISGSFTDLSSSLASELLKNTTDTLDGDLTVTGTVTAQEFHTEFVSSSIIFESGSTQFGNSSDDTHIFSGSIKVHSTAFNQPVGLNVTSDGKVGIGAATPTYNLDVNPNVGATPAIRLRGYSSTLRLQTYNSNQYGRILFATDLSEEGEIKYDYQTDSIHFKANQTDDLLIISSSGLITGSRFAGIFEGALSSSAQIASDISGSFTDLSSSLEGRVSANESFSASLDTTLLTLSGSFSGSFVGDGSQLSGVTSYTDADTLSYINTLGVVSGSEQINIGNAAGTASHAVSSSFTLTASYAANVPETSSYALSALSSSYALTASYADSGAGFPFNGDAIITGSFLVSGSSVDFTDVTAISGSNFSGSFFGDGTGLSGLGYGDTKKLNQTVAATTWSFSHNMNEQFPTVTVYNNNNEVIQPSKIEGVDAQTLKLYFGSATSGTAVAVVGGVATTQEAGFNRVFTQTSTATTWSFEHNLGNQYPQVIVYDSNDELVIPGKIEAVDVNNLNIYFDTAQSGTATATVGGTALTASYANSLVVTDRLLSSQENTDIDTGIETVATVSISNYDGAFFDYVAKDGTNYRAGTVMAVWDGSSVQYNDNSTADIGDTSGVSLAVDISGTDARLRATTTSDNWNIKAFIRAI